MKKSLISSLALLALLVSGPTSCSDDDPVGAAGATAILTQLGLIDDNLAFAAPYLSFASLVAPASVTIGSDEASSGDGEEVTVQAIAVNVEVDYSEVSGATRGDPPIPEIGNLGLLLFYSPTGFFYVAGTGGAYNPGDDAEISVGGDNPYAVTGESVAAYDGPDGDGDFALNNNDKGNYIEEGIEADATEVVEITRPCTAIPGFTVTGDGITIAYNTSVSEGIIFAIALDNVMASGLPSGDIVLYNEDKGGIDIPTVNVEVDINCNYEPVE